MIFISYRRDDESFFANHLYDAMANAFGKKRVMMDIDSIPLAVDFREYVSAQIRQARVALAVIGPRWEKAPDRATQQPRILSPKDYVRCELEAAHAARIPIIPVYISRDANLDERQLPESLRFLPFLNGVIIERNDAVHGTFRRLRDHIEVLLHPVETDRQVQSSWSIETRLRNASFSGIAIEHVPFGWELAATSHDVVGTVRVSSDETGRLVVLRSTVVNGSTELKQLIGDYRKSTELRLEVDFRCVLGRASAALTTENDVLCSQTIEPGSRSIVTVECRVEVGVPVTASIACHGASELALYDTRLWAR